MFAASLTECHREMRLTAHLSPIRVVLRQDTISFLSILFAESTAQSHSSRESVAARNSCIELTANPRSHTTTPHIELHYPSLSNIIEDGCMACHTAGADGEKPSAIYFQQCELSAVRLRIDYVPTSCSYQLDPCNELPSQSIAAFVSLRDVPLAFTRLRLVGATSWERLLHSIAAEWRPQLYSQLHRCLPGIAPVRCRNASPLHQSCLPAELRCANSSERSRTL